MKNNFEPDMIAPQFKIILSKPAAIFRVSFTQMNHFCKFDKILTVRFIHNLCHGFKITFWQSEYIISQIRNKLF